MAEVGCGSRMFLSQGFYPSLPRRRAQAAKCPQQGKHFLSVRLLCQFSGWLHGGLSFHEFIFVCSQFLSSRTVTTDHLEVGGTISKTLPAGRHPLTFQAASVILLVSAPGREGRSSCDRAGLLGSLAEARPAYRHSNSIAILDFFSPKEF